MPNYNSQLQSNNTDLQTVLQALQTKAAGGGISLPELTNEALASELFVGKELIGSDGNVVVGTMPNNGAIDMIFQDVDESAITIPAGYTSGGDIALSSSINIEVNKQADLIALIKYTIDNLPEANEGDSNSVETVTCTIIEDEIFSIARCYITYTDETMEIKNISSPVAGTSFKVAKNTIIQVNPGIIEGIQPSSLSSYHFFATNDFYIKCND